MNPALTPDAVVIAQALLRCPSVTPDDAGALDTLQRLLDAHGFVTHRVPFAEPGMATIDNLYARLGTDAPCLLFAGHTDVVPPGDRAGGDTIPSPARSPTADCTDAARRT